MKASFVWMEKKREANASERVGSPSPHKLFFRHSSRKTADCRNKVLLQRNQIQYSTVTFTQRLHSRLKIQDTACTVHYTALVLQELLQVRS